MEVKRLGRESESSDDSDLEVEHPLIRDAVEKPKSRNPDFVKRNRRMDVEGDLRLELMTKSKRQGWRRLLIGSIVAIVVIALIIAAVFLLTGSPADSSSDSPSASGITLEEWLGGSLATKSFNGTWLSGSEILFQDESGNLVIRNVTSGTSRTILEVTNMILAISFDYEISADRNYLLLASNYHKLYRHTYLAHYTIINLQTLDQTSLSRNNVSILQLATWGPQGNSLVYVLQNNIYYRPQAEIETDYELTTDGVFGTIYNGVPDWVYEEEVFSSNKALWFSPNGSGLVFGHFDDTSTPVMHIPYYGYPGSLSSQYTSSIPIHYPKSGTTNPTVKLFYVDLELAAAGNVTLVEISHPSQLDSDERILAAVAFPTNNLISATWMNRVQNIAYVQLCEPSSNTCTTGLSHAETAGWVEQFEPPIFSSDGTAFLLILPQDQGDSGAWRHLTMITNATSGSPVSTALTSGTHVVTEILSWDEDSSLVYYLATATSDPAQQHLYRVNITTTDFTEECLSCGVKSSNEETDCLYNTAKLSTDNSHYILTCAGPGVPEISVYSKDTTMIYSWEDNSDVAEVVAAKSLPDVKRYTVPVTGGFEAQVRLLIPPNADLTGNTKYPMLVYVYGGPDSYQVTERFNVDWGSYLVTNKSIIHAAIDGRGSGLKGNSMLFAGYRNLGTVEIYDQINVTKYLQDNLPFIDSTRTAIWGWSYGGYATGMSLALDYDGVFKCGMSVAPVTDWALYDSIYTERFMGLPTVADNIVGYEGGQLLNKADNIRNKDYYLIHGTLDDNVHYQQSLMLAKVLEQKDILFRQQTYTDEDHGIAQSRAHLYHSLENFLDDCFETSS
ncbi:venom dipeptidyl peptidase 4 isoform X1 [Neodiprion lecontei]|uniref:Venom dipeptidyl peptidase 4 isoform X1 n=1 Tax=Neodiprion lecontei TaxID=441921 RepID=A0ABM3FEJ4_NEOLC|nr:venom dipeptidyl peptidase 4 isoform X1 [Neodiprion lecontei]XP_046586431.1 venom dipeptidyl peptidase 4 isoform X1 [Neodiprion lecontei]XP_046586432.1 venom dipeptidyl peptidase 4 isoform X1 [Neodiprion lecontei]